LLLVSQLFEILEELADLKGLAFVYQDLETLEVDEVATVLVDFAAVDTDFDVVQQGPIVSGQHLQNFLPDYLFELGVIGENSKGLGFPFFGQRNREGLDQLIHSIHREILGAE
jgi:hypothetical protein